jgi:FkbM family methyltransferase
VTTDPYVPTRVLTGRSLPRGGVLGGGPAVAHPSLGERALDRVPFLEKELLLLRRIVLPGDVAVDVGAAGGAHLLTMARAVGPTGLVIGVEPRPGSLRILRRLVALCGWSPRVALHPFALTDRDGWQTLRIPIVPTRAHVPGTTLERWGAAAFARLPDRHIEVPTTTLDALVADQRLDRVDVIKCDVEGAELLVLAGAAEVLERHRPIVVVEADDAHQRRFDATAQDVLDAIEPHRYRPFRFRRGALVPVDGVIDGEDDYVLVPTERRNPLPTR